MKKLLFLFSILSTIALASCDNRENVEGQWQSAPLRLELPNTSTSTATMVMTFSQDGNVTINTSINLTEGLPHIVNADSISPYMISVSGEATISGTWRYVNGENDEVLLNLDYGTFNVNLDPDAVTIAENNITGAEVPTVSELKAPIIAKYTALLNTEMKAYYGKFTRLDDIKVQDSTLKFETEDTYGDDIDFILHSI